MFVLQAVLTRLDAQQDEWTGEIRTLSVLFVNLGIKPAQLVQLGPECHLMLAILCCNSPVGRLQRGLQTQPRFSFDGTGLAAVTPWCVNVYRTRPDHPEVLELVHWALCRVQDGLNAYEGTLNKFLMDDKGSTLLCAFGLPPLYVCMCMCAHTCACAYMSMPKLVCAACRIHPSIHVPTRPRMERQPCEHAMRAVRTTCAPRTVRTLCTPHTCRACHT